MPGQHGCTRSVLSLRADIELGEVVFSLLPQASAPLHHLLSVLLVSQVLIVDSPLDPVLIEEDPSLVRHLLL
jgi:hypothetical protein